MSDKEAKSYNHSKSWKDQPDVVLNAHILVGWFMDAPSAGTPCRVEVRRVDDTDTHYVTVGDLFQSVTLECVSAQGVLRLIPFLPLVLYGRQPVTLPPRTTLLTNAEV